MSANDLSPESSDSEFDFEMSSFQAFPTSSIRDDPHQGPSTCSPLAAEVEPDSGPISRISHPASPQSTLPHQLYPGIWSDNTISPAHPLVQDCLKQAKSPSSLRGAFHPIVYALSALCLFYKPNEKGHWAFWSAEKRERTAEIVNTIYFHKPPVLRSPVAWIGAKESLSVLANFQASWRPQLVDLPWYAPHAPRSETPVKRVLRKRTAVAASHDTSLADDDDEMIIHTPRKKVKTRRPPTSRKQTKTGNQGLDFIMVDPSPQFSANSPSPQPSPAHSTTSLPPAPQLQTTQTTPADDSVPNLCSSSPRDAPDIERQCRSRTRSSSQSSGDTAVSPTGGRHRSLSSVSALTAVASTYDKEEDNDKPGIDIDALSEESAPRARTRSGRTTRATTKTMQLKEDVDSPSAIKPIKRGRGRPRKNVA